MSKTNAENEIVTVHVVSVSKFFTEEEYPLKFRVLKYKKTKNILQECEGENGDVCPVRLHRIRKLPAVGGLFDNAAAALTKREAVDVLLRRLQKEVTQKERELEGVRRAVKQLSSATVSET